MKKILPSVVRPSSVLEVLEPKIAPAGVVSLTLANGVLTISGDGQPNQLTFSLLGDHSWSVADTVGAADTEIKVNGVSQGFSATISAPDSVKGALGGGDDEFVFDMVGLTGGITLAGGDGADKITVSQAFIGGGLTLDGGTGNDDLTGTNITVNGDLLFKGGTGSSGVSLTQSKIGKNVTFDLGAGSYEAGIGNGTQIGGNVKVVCGSSAPGFSGFGLFGDGNQILGSLTIGLGGGQAELSLGGNAGDSNLVVGLTKVTAGNGSLLLRLQGDQQLLGGLNIAAGGGANTLDTSNLNFLRTSAFTYTGGAGDDHITLAGSFASLGVTKITLGDGTNSFKATTSGQMGIHGSATIIGGKGADDIEFTSAFVTVNGLLSVNAGAGSNHLYVQPLVDGSLGALTYTGAAGDDSLRLNSAAAVSELFILGAVNVGMGAGAASEVTLQKTRLFGALNVSSTALTTETFLMEDSLISSAVSLKLNGAANATVTLDDVALASSILIDVGAGEDNVRFDNTAANSSRTSVFAGAVKVLLGAGDTDYFVAGSNIIDLDVGCVFGSTILIDGGAGITDSVYLVVGYGNTFSTVPTAASFPGIEAVT